MHLPVSTTYKLYVTRMYEYDIMIERGNAFYPLFPTFSKNEGMKSSCG